jgi:hypothetical protein
MYPATFREFLRIADPSTFDYVESISAPEHLPTVIFNKLATEYRRYQICGGMPEAASLMLDGAGMAEVDAALQDIGHLPETGRPDDGADLRNEFRLGDDDHLVNPGMGFENARRMLQDRLSGEFQELFRTIAPEPGAASARQDDTYSFHIPLK